jgi:isopenicillin N synthase-like dioxygenase
MSTLTSYATAKEIALEEIPVIDVGPITQGSTVSPQALQAVGKLMRDSMEAIGFFYVRNHGVDEALIAQVQALSRQFFASPLLEKLKLEPTGAHRGYLKIGEAKMYQKARADLKESYIWGIEVPADDPDLLAGNRMMGLNRWPDFLPEMQPVLNAYLEATHRCADRLLRALAVAMGAHENTFVQRLVKPISRAALVHYPPQPAEAGSDQFGVAPHTDYGVITLLHQDNVGGLQVATRSGQWVAATPIPGTLVVNSGDLLGRWSNDHLKSNPHRVVNASGRERYSIAVFVDPDYDTPIVPITSPGEAPLYPEVSCGDYILGRFDASFAYRAPVPQKSVK